MTPTTECQWCGVPIVGQPRVLPRITEPGEDAICADCYADVQRSLRDDTPVLDWTLDEEDTPSC